MTSGDWLYVLGTALLWVGAYWLGRMHGEQNVREDWWERARRVRESHGREG